MKQFFSITIFMILILFISKTHCNGVHLKSKATTSSKAQMEARIKAHTQQVTIQDIKDQWSSLFGDNYVRSTACSANPLTSDPNTGTDTSNVAATNKKSGWGLRRPRFDWIQRWGFGPVSYLFDYIDSIFQADFITEAQKIMKEIKTISKNDTADFTEPFRLSDISPNHLDPTDQKSISLINPDFDYNLWVNGTTTNQINQVILEWGWYVNDGSADPGMDFVVKFDRNGDGRLDPSELMLGIIVQNRKREGLFCYNCYYLLAKKIGALFDFLDCSNKGFLTSEELWNKFPNLARQTAQFNIFASGNLESIRTNCVNDFILKNGFTVDAGVVKNEFISGILLGYWNRQISRDLGVVTDNSRSQKALRWTSNNLTDIISDTFVKLNTPEGS